MKIVVSILLAILLLFSVACTSTEMTELDKDNQKVKIVTTLFAQYDFAKKIGGDSVDVNIILPPGVESHSYEPTPKDIVKMKEADLLIYTGEHMEPWVSKIKDSLLDSGVKIIDVSKDVKLLSDTREHHEQEQHHHMDKDPHIWLDFDNAITMINTIKLALIEQNSEHKADYEQNASEYIKEIRALDKEYKEAIARCQSKKIFTGGHFAFAYLANRYGLDYESPYKGFSPNAEPSPKDIAKIVDALKSKHVNAIYYEELVNPKVATILSQEADVTMLLLNAMHNVSKKDLQSGKGYLDFMKENLESLKKGLRYE